MDNLPYLLAMAICLLLAAFFSAAETAFLSLNKTRVRALAEKGKKRAKTALKLTENEERLSLTLTVGATVAKLLLVAFALLVFRSLPNGADVAVAVAVSAAVWLLFGEILPVTVAKAYPESIALTLTPPVRLFGWILFPITILFSLWKTMLTKIFKADTDERKSQEELLMLVDEVEQEGSIDRSEGNLLKNVIEFTDRRAEEILTPRVNLAGFSTEATTEEIARIFSDTKFSRLLVYENDFDHIIGVLHQKDFYTAEGVTDKPLAELLSEPMFIPQNESISDLLKLFQINQTHIAVVVDEYGETLGIVTMEDVLEELVGEIWDEHDEVVEQFRLIGDDTYEVSCEVNPTDFAAYFDVVIETECATLNGWIAEQLAKIPENDDLFMHERLTIKVVEVDSHRATFVTVVAPPKASEEETDDTQERQ